MKITESWCNLVIIDIVDARHFETLSLVKTDAAQFDNDELYADL